MSSLAEAFDVPYPLNDAGLNLQLPKLDIEDHANWCAEIKAAEMPGKLKRLPPGPPDVRFAIQSRIEAEDVPLDRIADMVYDPRGVAEFWHRSLAKLGMTDPAERLAVMRKLPAWRLQKIAKYISGRRANPLAGGGGGGSEVTSTPETGGTPGSSSPATPAASPSAG
jgi:hypothetical protein